MLRLIVPMPVRRLESHPYVVENAGRIAFMRGPLLYCVEGADNPGVDPRQVVLKDAGEVEATFRPDLLGGVVALAAEAGIEPPAAAWADRLYGPPSSGTQMVRNGSARVTAIPYYAWANREPGPMRVWLRRDGAG